MVLMVFVLQGDESLLRIASINGHLDVVKTLIKAGANVNQTNKVCIPWHCHYTSAMLRHSAGDYTDSNN